MFYDGYLLNKSARSNVSFNMYFKIEGVDAVYTKADDIISNESQSEGNGRKKNGTDGKNSKTFRSMFSH